MNYSDEARISRAVRQRDDAALAAAVRRLPAYDRDYDVVQNVVESAGGGRYVRPERIRLGTTTIYNRLGRAELQEATW